MRYLGWFIIVGEISGSIFGAWLTYTIPTAITNIALIITGGALIIIDRLKPNIKKDIK
jgi:hypothetical protein